MSWYSKSDELARGADGLKAECGLVTWERTGKFGHYRITARRVVRLLDQTQELLLHVGPLIKAGPRYRESGRVSPSEQRRPRR